jgi:hypothetical protein
VSTQGERCRMQRVARTPRRRRVWHSERRSALTDRPRHLTSRPSSKRVRARRTGRVAMRRVDMGMHTPAVADALPPRAMRLGRFSDYG